MIELPTEIIYHEILPYIPNHMIDSNMLKETKMKMKIYNFIKKKLFVESFGIYHLLFFSGKKVLPRFHVSNPDTYIYVEYCEKQDEIIDWSFIW